MKKKLGLFLVLAATAVMFTGAMCETKGIAESKARETWSQFLEANNPRSCHKLLLIDEYWLMKARNFNKIDTSGYIYYNRRLETLLNEQTKCLESENVG